jgi:hypothetical protein
MERILEALYDSITRIPPPSSGPAAQASRVKQAASLKAAAISGALSLPPGPAGMLTILPDLYMIWRIQGQMVADLAAVYGKTAYLTPEGMLHCLFKHSVAQAVRGMVVRAGTQLLIRRASRELIQSALGRIGVSLSERLASRAVSRWIPILGAAGVGAYAYYDTAKIARTATEVFESDLAVA